MKELLFKSILGYTLSQWRWFRKWYGGLWTKVQINRYPEMTVWIKGSPSSVLEDTVTIIETQNF